MDALNLTNLMQILQLIAIVAGIIVFLRKIPSRREMEQADNILRAEIRENRRQVDTLMANLETNFQALNEKLDALINKLQSDIREMNHDYKNHLAQHAIQGKLDEQNR